jgi:hypothetical protein
MKQEKNKEFENQTIIAYNDRFDKEKKTIQTVFICQNKKKNLPCFYI